MSEVHIFELGAENNTILHLHSAGVSLLLDLQGGLAPAVTHWGDDLGELTLEEAQLLVDGNLETFSMNNQDAPVRVNMLATHEPGWYGRTALEGARGKGVSWSPKFITSQLFLETRGTVRKESALIEAGAAQARIIMDDEQAGLSVEIEVELFESGLIRCRARLTNTVADSYNVRELGIVLPVPNIASELQDFRGHWGKERAPQRTDFNIGVHLREGRKGRTGADAAFILTAGEAGFGFEKGKVWGIHTAFSGGHRTWAERSFLGQQFLGGSELLLPGEVNLARGESYTGAWVYASFGNGQDEQATRIRRWMRSREQHPQRVRPVTINVWEAVYFDHNFDRLKDLADRAAAIGIERYVLDDGWFSSRRDDTSGLGDWVVSEDVWPNGLIPLIEYVNKLGMEFGLWFEPEMVNPDSDIARAHPEWILQVPGRAPHLARAQQVMNLSIEEAYAHVRDQIVAVLKENPGISYIKWDHNRDLLEPSNAVTGEPAMHKQTLAAYRLMDELKFTFPGLEIESCASGGARIDLEVLQHTDRVWTSDCIDPLERQQMHLWTQQLVPAEMMGSHIASGSSHTTGRYHSLHFRAATAIWGHLGVEWDLAKASQEELSELKTWIEFHKEYRRLIHSGDLVRMDQFDPSVLIQGVVAQDQSEALFSLTSIASSDVDPVGKFHLRGLDPDKRYKVRDVTPGKPFGHYFEPLWWPREESKVLTGRMIENVGFYMPALWPESARLLHFEAI
ncbi:alpha-galactosidase [Rothia aerolata]|uniref:Alpha-galactosidase n=1 Tax=Rothia aerolata TaxID=1812262 RepID=A0A917IWF9_9MICC|nr:alpha-galactosidase [Rothia aerolata]GGH65870.1 alpha-galactosidase [Rothia aerolata]